MKFKISVLALLIVGLVTGSAMAATVPNFAVAVNKDLANVKVAAGGTVVVGSFSVTCSTPAEDGLVLDEITIIGDAASEITLAELALEGVKIYEDININGLLDAGVDELLYTLDEDGDGDTTETAAWLTGGGIACDVTTPIFAASEKRYYIVTAKVLATAGDAVDGHKIASQLGVTEGDGDVVTPVNTTNDITVNVVATRLDFIEANIVHQIADAGDFVVGTPNVLRAVDDYGNLDLGYTGGPHKAQLSAALMADPSTGSGVVGGTSLLVFSNGIAPSVGALDYTLASGTTGDVVIVATGDALGLGLVGTTMINIGAAYPTAVPAPSLTRGAEFYDKNHNGRLDGVAVFLDAPVILGATPKTAFSVSGYAIASDPKIMAGNGGYGIDNGGEYAVTLDLTEIASGYDTDATPQVTYDAGGGQISTDRWTQMITVASVTTPALAVGDYVTAQNGVGGLITAKDATNPRILTVTFPDDAAVGGFSSAFGSNKLAKGRTYVAAGCTYITAFVVVDDDTDLDVGDTLTQGTITADVVATDAALGAAQSISEVYYTSAGPFTVAAATDPVIGIDAVSTDVIRLLAADDAAAAAATPWPEAVATTTVSGGEDGAADTNDKGIVLIESGNNFTIRVILGDWDTAADVDGFDLTMTWANPGLTNITSAAAQKANAVVGLGPLASISAAGITEVDKAAPAVISAKTLDSGNGGIAANGKVDGIQITISEDVDGVTMLAGKADDPDTKSLSLAVKNQKTVNEILSMAGTKTTADNKTFVFPVTEGSFLTTDSVPYIQYMQQDGVGLTIVDNATNVNGVPARNELIVKPTNATANAVAQIKVKDAVAPVVLNVTTNDTESTPDGHLDKFTVEFSEEVGIKHTGVSFASATFGTYDASTAAAVTGKIINYSVTENKDLRYRSEADISV